MSRKVLTLVVVASMIAMSANAQQVRPHNLVIVVLDSSSSFQESNTAPGKDGRASIREALDAVHRLFSQSSGERRRRSLQDDQYVIVAADASSQVIWSGDRSELGRFDADALSEILKTRRQFAYCTDYESALNAVAGIMHRRRDASAVYVLTFGDLVHEPPTSSYRTCAAPTGSPPSGIDWKTLSRAALGFYFVSTDYNLRPNKRWTERLEGLGINADFRDAAQMLVEPLELPPPPQAVYKPTAEQVAEARDRIATLKAVAWRLVTWTAAGFAVVATSLFVLVVIRRSRTARGSRVMPGVRRG